VGTAWFVGCEDWDDDGDMDEGLDGLGLAVEEAHAQVVGGATARLEGILVGCEAVAGEDVAAVEEVLGDVSVQVHRGTDHGLGADDAADGVDEVALGVVHALDAHSAVDVEEEAIEVFRARGVELMFAEIKERLHSFRADFDVFFHEDSLHTSGAVAAAIERLRSSGGPGA